jgi:hypothetical protein
MDRMSRFLVLHTPGAPESYGRTPKLADVQEKIYRDDEGYPIIHAAAMDSCLAEAGRSIRCGGGKLFSSRRFTGDAFGIDPAYLRLQFDPGMNPLSALPFEPSRVSPMFDENSPWRVDVRNGVGDRSFKNACIRPMFEQWRFSFRLRVHSEWLERAGGLQTLQLLFERAGRRVGLLSYRPANNGPFGRFKPDSIEEIVSS